MAKEETIVKKIKGQEWTISKIERDGFEGWVAVSGKIETPLASTSALALGNAKYYMGLSKRVLLYPHFWQNLNTTWLNNKKDKEVFENIKSFYNDAAKAWIIKNADKDVAKDVKSGKVDYKETDLYKRMQEPRSSKAHKKLEDNRKYLETQEQIILAKFRKRDAKIAVKHGRKHKGIHSDELDGKF